MRRRTFLSGLAPLGAGAVAGCTAFGSPEPANEFGYETREVSGVEVPLAPIADVIEWYEDDEALFVDTRNQADYYDAHIAGAVWSPAMDGQDENDPVEEYSTDTRVVTYCVCPHALSTSRGARLIEDGYTHTYAIDEGFEPWVENGYPTESIE